MTAGGRLAAAFRQPVRWRAHRRQARRGAACQDHPDVPEAGLEHHQQAGCLWVLVSHQAQASAIPQAVGPDVRRGAAPRQPEACRSARASRLERSSVRRQAADQNGPAAAWSERHSVPVLPSERARHLVPASAQAAFVPAAVKPGAVAAGSVLHAWSAAAVVAEGELPAWASEQRAPAAPMKAAEVEAASAPSVQQRAAEAEVASAPSARQRAAVAEAASVPSVQQRAAEAGVPDASRAAAVVASDVTAQEAAAAEQPGAAAAVVQPRAAEVVRPGAAAGGLQRAVAAGEPAAWPQAAAVPQVPSGAASVFRQDRLRLPAPARSRWALPCFVHAMRSLRMASR